MDKSYKMTKNTDLHSHSYYSDGSSSPEELIKLAKKRKIKNIALTDHNTIEGVKRAINEGKKIGVNVIPSVEVGSNDSEILGYFIDIKNKKLIDETNKASKRIEDGMEKWCKKLNKEEYNITFKEVKEKFPMSQGINELHILYSLYLKKYGTIIELYKNLIDQKLKPDKIKEITTIQAIKLIKEANGIPVLAHPWLGNTKKNFKRMKSLVKAGLKGIEINNGDSTNFIVKTSGIKDIVKKIKDTAKEHNLIITKGSDYHGEDLVKLMPGDHNLGKNNCNDKIVNRLKELSQSS